MEKLIITTSSGENRSSYQDEREMCSKIAILHDFPVYHVTFGGLQVQVFKTGLRLITKSGNTVKPTLSLHNIKVTYYVYHVKSASILATMVNYVAN